MAPLGLGHCGTVCTAWLLSPCQRRRGRKRGRSERARAGPAAGPATDWLKEGDCRPEETAWEIRWVRPPCQPAGVGPQHATLCPPQPLPPLPPLPPSPYPPSQPTQAHRHHKLKCQGCSPSPLPPQSTKALAGRRLLHCAPPLPAGPRAATLPAPGQAHGGPKSPLWLGPHRLTLRVLRRQFRPYEGAIL